MGDVADTMLDGTCCETCGVFFEDGAAPGHPRRCPDCQQQEAESPNRQRRRRVNRADRRRQAIRDFEHASAEARRIGLSLIQISDAHYQLSSPDHGWILNIYPGNCRLYHDENRPKGPYLPFEGRKWTLTDVVNAARAATQGATDHADHRRAT